MSIRVQRGERGAGKLLVDSKLLLKVLTLTDGRKRVPTTEIDSCRLRHLKKKWMDHFVGVWKSSIFPSATDSWHRLSFCTFTFFVSLSCGLILWTEQRNTPKVSFHNRRLSFAWVSVWRVSTAKFPCFRCSTDYTQFFVWTSLSKFINHLLVCWQSVCATALHLEPCPTAFLYSKAKTQFVVLSLKRLNHTSVMLKNLKPKETHQSINFQSNPEWHQSVSAYNTRFNMWNISGWF